MIGESGLPLGFDMTAVLAMAAATGVSGTAVAQFLPMIEAVMIEKLTRSSRDG